MEANEILSASMLDLVFDTRNKDYGAYELRRSYQKRITMSLLIAGGMVVLVLVGSVFARSTNDDSKAFIVKTVELTAIEEEEEIKLPPPKDLPEPEPVKTEKLTTIMVVDDEKVKEPPPSTEDLVDAKIDLIKQDGRIADDIVAPAEIDNGAGIIAEKKEESTEPWTKVEVEASFPGGLKKWLQFLERNCNGQVAADNNAPAGRHTVVFRFIVDENGQVSDIRPMTSIGYGMEEEGLKVIKKAASMKWTPGFQNGKYVKSYRTQPITFLVESE